MSIWTIALRVRSGAAIALPVVGAALALAPAASAATYNPTNTAALVTDIGQANTSGGANTIVLAQGTQYSPSAPITIASGDNLEITGPPQPNPAPTALSNATVLSGGAVTNRQANFITVAAGAALLMKAVNVSGSTSTASNNYAVEDQGYFEGDNVAFQGNVGGGVNADGTTQLAKIVLNDSSITDNVGQANPAVVNTPGSQSSIVLNNVTIANNVGGGLAGSGITMNNTLLEDNNNQGQNGNLDCSETSSGQVTSSNSMDDDGSCSSISAGTTSGGNLPYMETTFNGGPVSTVPVEGTDAEGAGGGCLPGDERFYIGASSCSVGSYQVGATADTTHPVCTVQSVNESSDPNVASTEVVNASDAGTGLGADAISGATTTNGTVSWPTVSGTPFDMTSPTLTGDTAAPSTAAFPVTATKPKGDLTAGDTSWSFTATSWAGLSTLCK